jgi:hypothetical protein
MPAVPFIAAVAVGSGAAAAIGTALVATITTATVSAAVATAIGSGVISAGITIAQGGKASDVLKSAVIGGVASYVGASVAGEVTKSVATAAAGSSATSSIAASLGKVAGSMAGGGVSSAVGSVLSGKGDPIQALIRGGLTAGLTAGVMEGVRSTLSNVPGFDKYDTATGKTIKGDAPLAVQRAVTAGLAAGAMGKDADKAVLNSLLSSGGDYLSRGIKDGTVALQTAYTNATKTGESLDNNIKRQEEIVKDYTSSAENIEAKRKVIQADLDKYNEKKALYDEGEIGVEEVNKYAERVNLAIPGYEAERDKVETKLSALSTELDELKTQLPTLEKTLLDQKTTLDTSVADFQKQEEENAQYVAKVFNDTVAAKTEVEQTLGAPLNQEQLDAFVQTGDVATAAKDYIDIKTTDLEEAQAAALAEGYRFDPNDPEMVARFLGVKDEAETLAAVRSFADARATTMQEATDLYTQTYADIYGPDVDIPPPTEEDLLAFLPQIPTDVSGIPEDYQGVAEDIVKGRIQDDFSQDLGFEDYQDRSFAQESLGEERPDAEYWGQFKDTSGVVGVEGSDVTPVQFGATDEAATFIPQAGFDASEYGPFLPDDQNTYAAADYGPFLPDDPRSDLYQQADNQFGFDTPGQVDPAQFDSMFADSQTSSDMVGPPTPADFGVGVADAAETPEFGFDTAGMGDVTADIPGAQTPAMEAPVLAATDLPQLEAGADLSGTELSTAPADLMQSDFDIPNVPVDTLAVPNMLDYSRDRGVQTAAYQPSNIMSDSDVGDIGLRSLITNQQGGTSGTADDSGIASLTDRNLTETTKPDLEATTKGSATYSALTDADPTKTIATSILDDESDDVRGGIQSSALYSGAENEFGASDTLTSKYLNEPDKEEKAAEDVGLTRSLGTGNDTQTYAEPRPTDDILRDTGTSADADRLDQFLSPLRTDKTTLPVSQEPARVTPTLGNDMEEYEDFDWDAWDRATADYQAEYDANRGSEDFNIEDLINRDRDNVQNNGVIPVEDMSVDQLLERDRNNIQNDGTGETAPVSLPNYGEGWGRPEGSDYQEFKTENGRVLYYDDGRVETFDNDGRYVMYGPDGSVVDYKNINDPTAKVQTYGPGANGKPSGTYEGGKFTPGITKPAGATSNTDKIANALTKALTNPKTAALIAGGALGAASGAKGIEPRGLRSIAQGTGTQRVQTGAKGTGGKGGVRYFERKAEGGAIKGGLGYLKSAHDGMEDKINATIDNKRPAKLSGGEFVVPADVVSHLGNGNSEAGAKQLYALMERVRKARTGTADQGKQINPKKYLPK